MAVLKRLVNGLFQCSYCREFLPKDRFGFVRSKAHQIDNRCRKCTNLYKKERYPKIKNTKKYKENKRRSSKIWQSKNPEKTKVYSDVHRAVKVGILIKPANCSKCHKKAKIHSHHKDYSKPLKVTWLCILCHEKEHHG